MRLKLGAQTELLLLERELAFKEGRLRELKDDRTQEGLVLLQKDDTGRVHFRAPINTPWAGQIINIHITICDNPTCKCEQIEASFFLNDRPLGDALIAFVDKRFLPPKTPIHKPMATRFGIAMCEHLTVEDWRLLSEMYLASKREATKGLDFSEFAPHFPYAGSIEVAGKMIAYDMILPYGDKLIFNHDDVAFEIDDLYCVKEDCDCTHVNLAFVQQDGYEFEGPAALLLNYQTEEIENDDEIDRTPNAAMLLARAKEQIPNFLDKIAERHLTLKKLYRNFRAEVTLEKKPSAPRIGRNASCPCGSGKKYKKCCGSVGLDV